MPYDPYDEEDYYNSGGERFSPGSETAVAFDEPSAGGVRYPIATPRGGSFDFSTVAPGLIRTPEQSRAAYDSISQYQAELARADRNRLEEMQQQDPAALQAAVRLQGLMKYRNLIQNGTNPAEAIRLAAPELYFNHPQATALATHQAPPAINPTISTVAVPGGNAILSNGKIHSVLKTPVERVITPTLPNDAKVLLSQATGERKRLESTISKIESDTKIDADEKKDSLRSLNEQLKTAKANEIFHSTNRLSAPNISTKASVPVEAAITPSQIDIEFLKSNPGKASLFEKKFGRGSSARYLQ